ncbi:MAG TPA: hydroxysqualene dehydroxylase HpnE [Terriglobia bacterium]|nr:hydroxysqualene dehydroxylase HpnE [Terriglobia bacterium]
MAPARVAVLGGGLAGMAAALRLAESGYAVELFEKRPALGGRASSFRPPGESLLIDNCQHVLLGCCTNLIDFFRRAGAGKQFRYFSRYFFHDDGTLCSLSASALPAPFHFLPSLAGMRMLSWQDRWAIARALLAILREPRPFPDEPLAAWLDRHGQSPAAKERFWKVILVSALNEELERLSTRPAFQVFQDAFLRNRRGYRMGVPAVPLAELYSAARMSGTYALALATPVAAVETNGERVAGIRTQEGSVRGADYYVSALPPDALANLLSAEQRDRWPQSREWAAFEWSPIAGIHLWFDRPILDQDHLTVCGRTIQWIFNKSAREASRDQRGAGQYVQIVISAARSLLAKSREEILELALRELRAVLPRSAQARLERGVVVKETKATFSFSPGADDRRPGTDTPFQNLFLAGDSTQTGWPATMEGAVRSGYRAAERVSEAAGSPRQFLVPDLPSDPLARLLMRS